MTTAYRLNLHLAFTLLFYCSVSLAGIRCHAGMLSRQKAIAQKEASADSVARYKIDSQLLQALAQQKEGKTTRAKADYPVNVGADSSGNLPVDISATITDSLLHFITVSGGTIIYPSKEYHTVRAIINLSVVKTIALRPDVTFVRPAGQAHNNGLDTRTHLR